MIYYEFVFISKIIICKSLIIEVNLHFSVEKNFLGINISI